MEKAMELVEQLAAKLGVAAEYLMTVLVKQQYAEGITSLIMAGISLLIIIAMLVIVPKVTKKMYKEDFFATMTYAIPIGAAVLGIVLLACGIDSIKIGVQQLINPEYFAFKEILDAISAG